MIENARAANAPLLAESSPASAGIALDRAPFLTIAVGVQFTLHLTLPAVWRGSFFSEAGRLALHSHEPDESSVLDVLRRRHGPLAAAQVLCEDGVLELHRAVCQLRGVPPARATAAQVLRAAVHGEASECAHALAMFCGLLGDVAGRAALTLGASGGVFVTGPVVTQLGDWFARSPFRRRFNAVGSQAETLRAIPTYVMPEATATSMPAPLRRIEMQGSQRT